ncbi:hypothetical protein [Gymnodinialimonas hymeniacidonis]|uniref:hypothetical protein n=1 Tax=Gymnodinialimonas hymeniacidonis TaxID=3126508 RepID=UPI0034C66F40
MSINPMTALQLATMNPLETDPSVMAVQLELPEGVAVVSGTAELRITTETATGEALDGQYPLVNTGDVWRVAEDAQVRMRADIARVRGWEAADPNGTNGSFSAGFAPCAVGGGPADNARFTMALQLEPGGAFLPLFDNVPLTRIYDAETVGLLQPCR